MFIVPFIHNTVQQNNINVNIIKILTIGGLYLWEENDTLDIDKDVLNVNDIYRKGDIHKINNSIYLFEIDTVKTNINDFYNWEEIDINNHDIFCWKTYTYITNNKDIWLEIPETEKLSNYMVKDIIKKTSWK